METQPTTAPACPGAPRPGAAPRRDGRRLRRRRRGRFVTTAALLGAVLLAAGCLPATEEEAHIWIRTVEERNIAGVHTPLDGDDTLIVRAREWAATLAAGTHLAHSDLSTVPTPWTAIAENVGYGPTPESVMATFLASAPHRANLLDPRWTHMGVGVATGPDGLVYVVQLFQAV